MKYFLEKFASVGAVLTAATCPACFPALAGIGSGLGLGIFSRFERESLVMMQILIALSIFFAFLSFRRTGYMPSFILSLVSGGTLFLSWHLYYNVSIFYLALLGLVIGAFWNFFIERKLPSCSDGARCSKREYNDVTGKVGESVDLYTTIQCGFCQQLKGKLDNKGIKYIVHDVEKDKVNLEKLKDYTHGGLSVPVTVVNAGAQTEKVIVGYPDAAQFFGLEDSSKDKSREEVKTVTLRCPECGHEQEGEIPTIACVPFYECEGCKETLQAQGGDCCVFCSYSDTPCPLKSKSKCSGGTCTV